jgi:hypothetical protein
MNRKLLATLLRKEIQELEMITEGFMEMSEYPKAIILLAQRKTEDIQAYIKQLSELNAADSVGVSVTLVQPEEPAAEIESVSVESIIMEDSAIDTNTEVDILEEVEGALEFTSELIDFSEAYTPEEEEESMELIIELPKREPVVEQEVVAEERKDSVLEEKSTAAILSRNELLSKTDNSLGSVLANKKIDDIKQAISIGDRFRFQRELFKGNGEDMNKTLNYINQLATLDEVQSFLQSKYKWSPDNEAVEDFYQIVRRRFI